MSCLSIEQIEMEKENKRIIKEIKTDIKDEIKELKQFISYEIKEFGYRKILLEEAETLEEKYLNIASDLDISSTREWLLKSQNKIYKELTSDIARIKTKIKNIKGKIEEEIKKLNLLIDQIIQIKEKGNDIFTDEIKELKERLEKIRPLIGNNLSSAKEEIEKIKGKISNLLENSEYINSLNTSKIITKKDSLISKIKQYREDLAEDYLKTLSEKRLEMILKDARVVYARKIEEEQRTKFFRKVLERLETTDEELNKVINVLLYSEENISEKQFQEVLEKYHNTKIDQESKEQILEELALKGYEIEDESGNKILTIGTGREEYKVLLKINNGKLTAKLIRLVGKQNYQPSIEERLKDEEFIEEWCKDLESIRKSLLEKGIVLQSQERITSVEAVEYKYDQRFKEEEASSENYIKMEIRGN